MAEALLLYAMPSALASQVEVGSAGTHAIPGAPATREAIAALARRGGDLSRHRSRPLTPELIRSADLVLGMEAEHINTPPPQIPVVPNTPNPEEVRRAKQDDALRAIEELASAGGALLEGNDLTVPAATVFADAARSSPGMEAVRTIEDLVAVPETTPVSPGGTGLAAPREATERTSKPSRSGIMLFSG